VKHDQSLPDRPHNWHDTVRTIEFRRHADDENGIRVPALFGQENDEGLIPICTDRATLDGVTEALGANRFRTLGLEQAVLIVVAEYS
jgi:hypothetical protein